jgi:hypothetical protein
MMDASAFGSAHTRAKFFDCNLLRLQIQIQEIACCVKME